jgi:hypothetical protein
MGAAFRRGTSRSMCSRPKVWRVDLFKDHAGAAFL